MGQDWDNDNHQQQEGGHAYPAAQGSPIPPPAYNAQPSYPQPHHGPPPPMGGGTQPVYVAYACPAPLGARSQIMQCPHCHAQISTKVEYNEGVLTWLLCFLFFFFLCWICCFIPFCIDDCKDVVHKCPNCNVVIGEYKRI